MRAALDCLLVAAFLAATAWALFAWGLIAWPGPAAPEMRLFDRVASVVAVFVLSLALYGLTLPRRRSPRGVR